MSQRDKKLSQEEVGASEMDRVAIHLDAPTIPIITGLWIGLLTGYLEGLYLIVHRSMIDPFTYLSRHFIWMAPAANAMIFLSIGLLFAFLMYVRPSPIWHHWTILICASFGYLSLLFLLDEVHPLASILLAAGLGYRTALLLRSRFLH